MRPMTHEEAQTVMLEWADVLGDDNYTIWAGFGSDGPLEDSDRVQTVNRQLDRSIIIVAARQGNVLQWSL